MIKFFGFMKKMLLFVLISACIVSVYAQSKIIEGTYLFLKDSDGSEPKEDARITLQFLSGELYLLAVMPEETVEDNGKYTLTNGKLTVIFDSFEFGCSKADFTFQNGILTLPFSILGGDGNASDWKLIEYAHGSSADGDGDGDGNGDGNGNGEGDGGGDGDGDNNSGDNGWDYPEDQDIADMGKPRTVVPDQGKTYPEDHFQGRWYGQGWGWEVRFKHTSGDFVSQFSGINKGDLPFDNEKIIMSLMVQHGTSFYFNVDEHGNITGEGMIIYNLIPNLCAVAALTNSINQVINLSEKVAGLFLLSGKLGQASVQDLSKTFLGMDGQLGRAAKMGWEVLENKGYSFLGDHLVNKVKALDISHAQREAMCQCSAGIPAVGAGNKVGPSTVDELIKTFGVDVAKALFMDLATGSLPGGLLLSIPGVTQVQYYYKGLVNGPEVRNFTISGRIDGYEMYLKFENADGDPQLYIEYQVNYQTDKSSFPIWSPFLSEPGMIVPSGTMTEYELEQYEVEQEFVDPATGKKQKMKVPRQRLVSEDVHFDTPFAVFNEAGTKRNNVSVWHEYEYNWTAYKFNKKDE